MKYMTSSFISWVLLMTCSRGSRSCQYQLLVDTSLLIKLIKRDPYIIRSRCCPSGCQSRHFFQERGEVSG